MEPGGKSGGRVFPGNISKLDRPEIQRLLFFPRPEDPWQAQLPDQCEEVTIPVAPGVALGARFFFSRRNAPNLLFFHGNGEIVADYTDLGQIYQSMGMHFIPVDYRGYGRSSGTPSIGAMLEDAHAVFAFFRNHLERSGEGGAMIVMGRSLGSVSALELAAGYEDAIDSLIIESGFAHTKPLLERLGLPADSFGPEEEVGLGHLEKIRRYREDTLIIHGEEDEIIPFEEGQDLYEASGASRKRLLRIPGAGHNDLLLKAAREYLQAVRDLAFTRRTSSQ